jgi:hypothetical protein
MKITLNKYMVAAMAGLWSVAAFAAAPRIQFDESVYDFGKTSQVETVSGIFKFKNTGDGVLKLETPEPSCGCTVASLKPDILQPGERGELTFSLNLGNNRGNLEKHISIRSNDPTNATVSLTIRVDYTPLYDLDPLTLSPHLAFGETKVVQSATLTRTDGKPLHILKLDPSKPWITAKVAGNEPDASTKKIVITVERNGLPRRFNEFILVYAEDQTNAPISTISLYGQVMGEVSVSPESLYWSVIDGAPISTGQAEALAMRRVTIRSADGNPFELKNPRSTIQDIQVEVVPKESGKAYELVATLSKIPGQTVSGSVSFETSVAAQPRIELPVIVNVSKQ